MTLPSGKALLVAAPIVIIRFRLYVNDSQLTGLLAAFYPEASCWYLQYVSSLERSLY